MLPTIRVTCFRGAQPLRPFFRRGRTSLRRRSGMGGTNGRCGDARFRSHGRWHAKNRRFAYLARAVERGRLPQRHRDLASTQTATTGAVVLRTCLGDKHGVVWRRGTTSLRNVRRCSSRVNEGRGRRSPARGLAVARFALLSVTVGLSRSLRRNQPLATVARMLGRVSQSVE